MIYSLIIIIYLILFFILSWRRLDWAVMLILFALPSYLIRFNILGIPFTLLEAMILISFAVWFIKNYKEVINNIKVRLESLFKSNVKCQKLKVTRYPFDVEIVVLIIISFISAGLAGFSNSSMGIWKAYFFEPVLFYLLLFNVFKSDSNDTNDIRMTLIYKIICLLAVSALGISLLAIYQKITGQLIFNPMWAAEGTRRVVSFFGYPNAVGLYLAPIIMLMIGLLLYQITNIIQNSKLWIFFLSIISILSILSIYFAHSKGAMLGLSAGLIIFGILANKKIRIIIMILIIASLTIFIYTPARNYAWDKITLSNLSGEIRKQQWRETWEMFYASKTRLIFGAGLNNYQVTVAPHHQEGIFFNKDNDPDFRRKIVLFSKEYKAKYWQPVEIYMYPHNIFLNFWSELGILGMLLFCWIFVKFFYLGFKNLKLIGNYPEYSGLEIGNLDKTRIKYLNIGLMCSMVVALVHGFVDVPYFKNDLSVMFWVIVAMMGMMNLELRTKKTYEKN